MYAVNYELSCFPLLAEKNYSPRQPRWKVTRESIQGGSPHIEHQFLSPAEGASHHAQHLGSLSLLSADGYPGRGVPALGSMVRLPRWLGALLAVPHVVPTCHYCCPGGGATNSQEPLTTIINPCMHLQKCLLTTSECFVLDIFSISVKHSQTVVWTSPTKWRWWLDQLMLPYSGWPRRLIFHCMTSVF